MRRARNCVPEPSSLRASTGRREPMKTRAAVAWEAAKPLSIETIELEGPKAGEVLVETMATGICHTDAYTLSRRFRGKVPRDPRPRGRRHRARDRSRRDDGEGRRARH